MNKRELLFMISICTLLSKPLCISCSSKPEGVNRIIFRNEIPPEAYTKSPFETGKVCEIHIIHTGTRTLYSGGTPLYAVSDLYGYIVPYAPVALESGYYDFYLVSANTGVSPALIFNNGYARNLKNGYDYLWSGMKGVTVTGDRVLTFVFSRVSCKVQLTVKASSAIKNMKVKRIEFALPQADMQTFDLLSGKITGYTGDGALTTIEGEGAERVFTMLPKSGNTEIAVELDGEINGIPVVSKRFSTNINNGFFSGFMYIIDLEIENDLRVVVESRSVPWRYIHNENVFNYLKF